MQEADADEFGDKLQFLMDWNLEAFQKQDEARSNLRRDLTAALLCLRSDAAELDMCVS